MGLELTTCFWVCQKRMFACSQLRDRALWGTEEIEEASQLMDECLSKGHGFPGCRVFQIASHVEMGNRDQAWKAVTALLSQYPNFSVEDALKIVGFAGDQAADERLATRLSEAGLPTDIAPAAAELRRP